MRIIGTCTLAWLCASSIYADTSTASEQDAPMPRGYVRGELGGSFSRYSSMCAPSEDWTDAPQGYGNSFGNSPMSGLGIGMYINRLVAVGLSAQSRPDFSYSKAQTPPDGATENPCNFFPSLGTFCRQFDISNTSYMIDLFLNRAGRSSWYVAKWGSFEMAPYVGASIGLSTSWVSNLRTNTDIEQQFCSNIDYSSGIVRAVMTAKSFNKFGWQLHAGIDFPINETVTLGIGYRYFSGGTLQSNDYMIDPIGNPPQAKDILYTVCPWEWKLRSNELVISLSLSI